MADNQSYLEKVAQQAREENLKRLDEDIKELLYQFLEEYLDAAVIEKLARETLNPLWRSIRHDDYPFIPRTRPQAITKALRNAILYGKEVKRVIFYPNIYLEDLGRHTPSEALQLALIAEVFGEDAFWKLCGNYFWQFIDSSYRDHLSWYLYRTNKLDPVYAYELNSRIELVVRENLSASRFMRLLFPTPFLKRIIFTFLKPIYYFLCFTIARDENLAERLGCLIKFLPYYLPIAEKRGEKGTWIVCAAQSLPQQAS